MNDLNVLAYQLNSNRADRFKSNIWLNIAVLIAVAITLYMSSRYSYLLFHNIAELFSIMIAFALFIVSWNTREYTDEPNLVYLGIAYLFVGIIDLFHTLSYKGMNIFTDYPFYANQLWVGARYLESFTLLIFTFLTTNSRDLPNNNKQFYYIQIFFVYAAISLLILLSIFYWKSFPVCFVQEFDDGRGYQTNFKIISGYIVIIILMTTALILYKKREAFSTSTYRLLIFSMVTTTGSEFCFTLYISNYGPSNQIGHFLKIVSFYLIYRAIIETGLRNPFDLMFRKLKENEQLLLIAKDKAESASRAKSSFLANMSHELRTPLNGVLGYAQILKRSSETTQFIKDGLNVIEQSGHHLLTLINDILDLSKIEAGKMELYPVEFSFTQFLDGIVGIIKMRANQKNLQLATIFDTNLPEVLYADETRLRQVLLNLLGNAIKFTENGTVTLSVHKDDNSANLTQKNSTASFLFKISDTGVGITPENLSNLFKPFSQVGDSARKAQGTGLGLAISKELVELMGGDIEVESTPGKGSSFWFKVSFPVIELAQPQPKENSKKEITGYIGERKTILVIDDILENRLLLMYLLESIGFTVYMAEDGKQALDMVDTAKPDLIITDLVMPVMTGFEFVKAIRQRSEFEQTPILALSASTYPLDESKSLKVGCNGFISKPVDTLKLFDFLSKHLSLNWTYQQKETTDEQKIEFEDSSVEVDIIFPPRADLNTLYELAMLGKIAQIEEFTEQLKRTDKRYHKFAQIVRSMAAAFEDEKIVMMISSYLEKLKGEDL